MSASIRQSISRRGFIAAMAASSATLGALALSTRGGMLQLRRLSRTLLTRSKGTRARGGPCASHGRLATSTRRRRPSQRWRHGTACSSTADFGLGRTS
jgi:hypothetical protein